MPFAYKALSEGYIAAVFSRSIASNETKPLVFQLDHNLIVPQSRSQAQT